MFLVGLGFQFSRVYSWEGNRWYEARGRWSRSLVREHVGFLPGVESDTSWL